LYLNNIYVSKTVFCLSFNYTNDWRYGIIFRSDRVNGQACSPSWAASQITETRKLGGGLEQADEQGVETGEGISLMGDEVDRKHMIQLQ
ncbi:MAG: hypothetical protein SPI84_03065, partial [Anaerovoracaceae bacterium]|nr:hypothetical protein [Anaerovoracaceae bacterium]